MKLLTRCITDNGFDLSNCVARCYDGAFIKNRHAGVLVLFREQCGIFLVIMYTAVSHRLNLVLVDGSSIFFLLDQCTAVRCI